MATILDYQRPMPKRPSRLVPRLANLTLLYPLIMLGTLYGEWGLAWLSLGHVPRVGMDDPNDVLGGVVHLVTGIAFVGILPAAALGLGLNVMWVVNSRLPLLQGVLRLLLFAALWPALYLALWWDPLAVGSWWID